MGVLEELNEKNTIRVFNDVSKLVDVLKEKLKGPRNHSSDVELPLVNKMVEFEKLKALCGSSDALTSLTACEGLVSLVQCNSISMRTAFIVLESILITDINLQGLTSAILSLILLNLKIQIHKNGSYINPLTCWKKHPLCKLLYRNPNSCRLIINQMSSICCCKNKVVSDNALKLLEPIFNFILIESPDLFSDNCKQQAWKILIKKSIDQDKNFIYNVLSSKYMKIADTRDPLDIANDISLLLSYSKLDEELMAVIILLMVSLVQDTVAHSYNPSSIISQLKLMLDGDFRWLDTVVLIIFSKTVNICPAVYLIKILDFCEWLINKGHCNRYSVWMLVVSLLPWLNCTSAMLSSSHRCIYNIISYSFKPFDNVNTSYLTEYKRLPCVISCNYYISSAIQLAWLCDSMIKEQDVTDDWLSKLPDDMIEEVYLLVGAILISCSTNLSVKKKAINILKMAPSSYAPQNLTVFLYQCGREKESTCQLELLRALVTTATDRNNVPSLIHTLRMLEKSGGPQLQMLTIDLYMRLWDVEERCYPFLLEAISNKWKHLTLQDSSYSIQMDIICANAFRHICQKMPEKHGKELVKPMQNLLMKCLDNKEGVPSSFIIEALASLVKSRLLSGSSTWKQLSPLTKNVPSRVCISFCLLIEACMENSIDEDVLDTMCCWLWNVVSLHKNNPEVNAALRTLKKFSVDTMKLKLVPECYRHLVKLPKKLRKTPGYADRDPVDVLDYIPGNVWVEFLQNIQVDCLDSACELISHWLTHELSKYSGGVYNITGLEPSTYEKLSEHSVCRGLVDWLRKTSCSFAPETDCQIYKIVFRVLCNDRIKPLPPINWSFLVAYFQHPDIVYEAYRLASKEAKGSLSARALIEKVIKEDLHSEDKDLFLYSLLPDLARGVPPTTLSNLLDRTLKKAYQQQNIDQVKFYISEISKTLAINDVHEANRSLFNQMFQSIWKDLNFDNVLMDKFLESAVNLNVQEVESMSSINTLWETVPEKIIKCMKLRFQMALSENTKMPFVWLNEPIDSAHMVIPYQEYIKEEIEKVLIRRMGDDTAWPWLEDLLAHMVHTKYRERLGLDFMFSVFRLSVDIISKYSVLFFNKDPEAQSLRFPQALRSLLIRNKINTIKISEKLKFLEKSLAEDNRSAIHFGLSALL